ncbi:DUF3307 domain-containing protein [Streptomyces sp. B1866]|uniref:DUF3307 domain-containing protein n=1 Tax=Streptomyces sp. B1866 TaxID=3075431 RepID=UPI00288E78F5|nr:DUF3307 domain-containing protein [Streptomyces sp. B1866]MDT3395303.1 DUF3307 domain-containing protein [Streptomyces sp. B1866]
MRVFEGLLAHLIGDFVLQSEWLAAEKVKRWWPAVLHGLLYGLPFLFITRSLIALALIVGTHIVLDRYRAAKYLVWFRNLLAPAGRRPAWAEARTNYGSPRNVSRGLALGLLIVTDNTVHLSINFVALAWWG